MKTQAELILGSRSTMRLRTLNKLTADGKTSFPVRGDQLTSHRDYIEHPRTWNHDPAYTEDQQDTLHRRARHALIAWKDYPSAPLLTALMNAMEHMTGQEINTVHSETREALETRHAKSTYIKMGGMFHDPEGNEY